MARFAEYDPRTAGHNDETVTVRPAVPGDAAAIVAVDATREPRPASHLARVAGQLARSDAVAVVAEAGGVVIGSSSVTIWQGHADAPIGWYVSGITVVPQWRRRHVAHRMLEAELATMDATGATTWSVVNATNRASLDLHAQHGFHEVARSATFAGLVFTGGCGIMLRRRAPRTRT